MRNIEIDLSTSNAVTLAALAEFFNTSVEALSSSLLAGSTNLTGKAVAG